MALDVQNLQEVVVIGYGTVAKKDATGSVVAIGTRDFNKGSAARPQDLIMGKIPGVQIVTDGGSPSGSSTIRIRGGSSLSASNDPLIVIDGVPVDNNGISGMGNALSLVNSNDIESFTVLKDASATAIYGSRASNGVIIITTKKGVAGKPVKVTYDGSFSFGNKTGQIDNLSSLEFRNQMLTKYAPLLMHFLWVKEIQTGRNRSTRLPLHSITALDFQVVLKISLTVPPWVIPIRPVF
jgi:iron complex outermembrane receptor protein